VENVIALQCCKGKSKSSQAYVVTVFSAVWDMCAGCKIIFWLPVKDPCSEHCWEGGQET